MKNSKKIVVCLDGTFNEPLRIKREKNGPATAYAVITDYLIPSKQRISKIKQYFEGRNWTNVSKIRYLISEINDNDQKHQITTYFRGVGSGLDDGHERTKSGATGIGLEYQILDAYQFLSDNFVPGDDIYLVGYSRGAIAARAVASMIETSGLLKGENAGRFNLDAAWTHYFHGLGATKISHNSATAYWEENGKNVYKDVRIKALALWDSVTGGEIEISRDARYSASPLKGTFRIDQFASLFEDTNVPSNVENVFHAMAIDEFRQFFKLVPFHGVRTVSGSNAKLPTVVQVWFPGSHGNVGGGCNDKGLSDIALDWMIEKLKGVGLQFHEQNVAIQVKKTANGKIFDSTQADLTGEPPYGYGSRFIRPVEHAAVKSKILGEKVHSSVVALWSAQVRLTRQSPIKDKTQDRVNYPLEAGADRWKDSTGQLPFHGDFIEAATEYKTFRSQLGKFAGPPIVLS